MARLSLRTCLALVASCALLAGAAREVHRASTARRAVADLERRIMNFMDNNQYSSGFDMSAPLFRPYEDLECRARTHFWREMAAHPDPEGLFRRLRHEWVFGFPDLYRERGEALKMAKKPFMGRDPPPSPGALELKIAYLMDSFSFVREGTHRLHYNELVQIARRYYGRELAGHPDPEALFRRLRSEWEHGFPALHPGELEPPASATGHDGLPPLPPI